MTSAATHTTPSWRSAASNREGKIYIEPSPRYYRLFSDKVVNNNNGPAFMESKAAYLVWESTSNSPQLAFIKDEVKWARDGKKEAGLVESKQGKGSSKLASQYYDLILTDGSRIESVGWSYSDSIEIANDDLSSKKLPSPSQLIALMTSKFPSALEEDVQILDHVKNPYHRVDAVHSSRHIQVYALARSGKEVLIVDTAHSRGGTQALFETGLPTRWYLPADAFFVNSSGQASMHPPPACRLQDYPSNGLQTICPYKGIARYHSLTLPEDSQVLENIAWSYPENLPELDLRGLVSLWTPGNQFLKLVVDGEEVKG